MEINKECVKLSVIVPVYNIVSCIDRCVESIVNQTYYNMEIILVDDGSTDGSDRKCDLWTQKDARIRVIHKKNGGLVSARQAGVETATGDYLAQVDGDDWIEKEMYEDMLKMALSCDADIVTTGLVRDYAGHSVTNSEKIGAGIYRGKKLEELWTQMIDVECFFRSRINGHITTKIYKTGLIKDLQMQLSVDARIGDDAAVVYPCFLAANCIAVLGQNYYHYVMRPGSVMDSLTEEEKSLKAVEYALARAVEKHSNKVPNIKLQFDLLFLYVCLLSGAKSILRCEKNDVYPFSGLKKGDSILLYGAGRFGKIVYKYIEESKVCKITAWADKSIREDIVSIEDALKCSYDKVVIAVLLADVSEKIKAELVAGGVDAEKIVQIKCDTIKGERKLVDSI